MSEPRRKITIDAALARALQRFAIGELGAYEQHPNGDITFEIDDEVAAALDGARKPGESDSAALRRMIEDRTDIPLKPSKPN